MSFTRQSHSIDPETIATLLQRKKGNGSLRKLATNLGFPASYNATLSDILRDRPGAITLEGENILRRTLGLPVIQTRTARACPSCGAVHGEGLDCHNQPVASVALLRPGEQVRPTPPAAAAATHRVQSDQCATPAMGEAREHEGTE